MSLTSNGSFPSSVRLSPGYVNFDMAILRSDHIVVDEAGLTGEVNPIAKIPLDSLSPGAIYNQTTNKASTIFAGTTILECGNSEGLDGDLAIVTQTGSFTAKGELLSDVLSYERHLYKFDREIKLVLLILIVEAIILVAITVRIIEGHRAYSWFYGMFVLGTVIPPLLPTAFVVSVGISTKRLQEKRITCTDPTCCLAAGKVNRALFDKTGTLTEQGLKFVSAQEDSDIGSSESEMPPLLQLGLAVCHTLTLSESGDLIGPNVDREAFGAISSAMLLANGDVSLGGVIIKSLKRFDFDHHSTTQSVIVEYGGEKFVFVKGSPEAISSLCDPSSIPTDFEAKARNAARNGMYQLAIARSVYKGSKDLNEIQRSEIEKELIFCGSVHFQNQLKQEATEVISELKGGNVESAIVTGDSVLTGVFVAKKAGIIPPKKNVVVGMTIRDVFEHLLNNDPESAGALSKHTAVFGRCNPVHKVRIVSTFIEKGGNDCGALSAAHVGVALSNTEASIVAPFTSIDKKITAVTEILREGRCALASTLASYKYMLMYGQVETINQVANAYFNSDFGEWCWPITMAFSLPLSKAASKLGSKRPTSSILGAHTVSSACGVLGIHFFFLAMAFVLLYQQDWFQCRKWDGQDISLEYGLGDNYEVTR
eukprot:scaffold73091_cov22-Cyclotella_meneghiniana.AAC.2